MKVKCAKTYMSNTTITQYIHWLLHQDRPFFNSTSGAGIVIMVICQTSITGAMKRLLKRQLHFWNDKKDTE